MPPPVEHLVALVDAAGHHDDGLDRLGRALRGADAAALAVLGVYADTGDQILHDRLEIAAGMEDGLHTVFVAETKDVFVKVAVRIVDEGI